jgi:hypothetical protein
MAAGVTEDPGELTNERDQHLVDDAAELSPAILGRLSATRLALAMPKAGELDSEILCIDVLTKLKPAVAKSRPHLRFAPAPASRPRKGVLYVHETSAFHGLQFTPFTVS